MDASPGLIPLRNQKGLALIYIIVVMGCFGALLALMVDIGYMYLARNQLQKSSDAAALAGAGALRPVPPPGAVPSGPPGIVEVTGEDIARARTAALTYAGNNTAAGTPVAILDAGNSLSESNDITVGHWDATARNYTPNGTPVNAVQARSRRTATSPGGEIAMFMSRFADFALSSWPTSTSAIAALPFRATSYLTFCKVLCELGNSYPNFYTFTPPRVMNLEQIQEGDDPGNSVAWTSLLNNATSSNGLSTAICTEMPMQEVCGRNIYTSNGANMSVLRDMASTFYNPDIDRPNKELDAAGNVTGWWVIMPITEDCPPGAQPAPYYVSKYAYVRITRICATGGTGCGGYKQPGTVDCKDYMGTIAIDRISCIDCAGLSTLNMLGLRPALVDERAVVSGP